MASLSDLHPCLPGGHMRGGRRGEGLVSVDRLGEREEECRPVDWMDLEPGICSRDSIGM